MSGWRKVRSNEDFDMDGTVKGQKAELESGGPGEMAQLVEGLLCQRPESRFQSQVDRVVPVCH